MQSDISAKCSVHQFIYQCFVIYFAFIEAVTATCYIGLLAQSFLSLFYKQLVKLKLFIKVRLFFNKMDIHVFSSNVWCWNLIYNWAVELLVAILANWVRLCPGLSWRIWCSLDDKKLGVGEDDSTGSDCWTRKYLPTFVTDNSRELEQELSSIHNRPQH